MRVGCDYYLRKGSHRYHGLDHGRRPAGLRLDVAGTTWTAIVDTGFNGDLELPIRLQSLVNARFICRNRSLLAAGQIIEEDSYIVDFPFDGQICLAEATYGGHDEILIGGHLLRDHCLEINYPAQTVRLERVI